MQTSNKNENMGETVVQFIIDLSRKLETENEILQKSVSEYQGAIKGLRLQKQQFFSSMCNEFNVVNPSQLHLVSDLTYSTQLWKTSLQSGLHQITQGVTQHNAVCDGWKKQIEHNLELKQDDFTMMPFHSAEEEINVLDVKITRIMEETAKIMKETQSKTMSMETQTAHILEDLAIIEPYHKEMREHIIYHINIISEIKRKRNLNDFQMRLDAQQLVKLQNEIDEIQEEITDLEKNSIN